MWALLLQAALAGTPAEDQALEDSQRRLRNMVSSCQNSAGAQNASGRVELDVQAHAGELVSLMVGSEVGVPALSECFCTRAPVALRDWIQAVETDAAISLPFILTPEDGSAGTPRSPETLNCRLNLGSATSEPAPEVTFPPGTVTLKKVSARGALDAADIEAVLVAGWTEIERCYRADLIRHPGYTGSGNVLFSVGADGVISGARVEGIAHNSITNCQVQHLMSLSFPSSDGRTEVKVTLSVQPEAQP